jgi:drug/metabolite transporter (DMT)-like permease
MFLLILLNALGGATYPLAKAALQYAPLLFMTGVRMFIAGLLLIAFEWWRGNLQWYTKKTWYLLILLALFNVYITNALQFWALNYVDAGKAAFIYNLTPFISAFFAYLIFKQALGFKKMAGLLIGFVSFIPLILYQSPQEVVSESFSGFKYLPEIALLLGAVSSVFGWMIMKQLYDSKSCTIVSANGISMFLGSFLFFPTIWLLQSQNFFPVSNYAMFAVYLVALIFANNIIAYNGFAFLMKRYSTTLLFFAGFLTPLFATLYGWLFLGEKVTWHFLVAALGVSVGLFLFYKAEVQNK